MASDFEVLTALTTALQDRLSLDVMLQRIADGTARLLDTPRVSVRLFDPNRTHLVAVCRPGAPEHLNPGEAFQLGEGLLGWIAREGKPLRTDDAEHDPRFVPRADVRETFASFLGVPLVCGRTCMGVLSALHPEHARFTAHHEELLQLIAGICAPHLEVARLSQLSQADPLTGALNRRGLDLLFPEGDGAMPVPTSVVMCDVDRFKRINDEYGHVIGDEVLKRVAQLLQSILRTGDAVVRYGGEEFLLVLPRVSLTVAGRVAERARSAIESGGLVAAGVEIKVTISLGVAERLDRELRTDLLARADAALYRAKSAGRNRVEVADRRAN